MISVEEIIQKIRTTSLFSFRQKLELLKVKNPELFQQIADFFLNL